EDQLRQKIKDRGDPEKCGQAGNNKKHHAKKDTLARAAFTAAIVTRDHLEAGASIIVAIHPRDREKMRQLPKKQNREKHPRSRVERSARRRPTNHRWQCTRDRAKRRVESADTLQRRVSEDVNDDGDRGESRAERIAYEREIGHAEDRQCGAENNRVPWSHSSGRNRARSRSLH